MPCYLDRVPWGLGCSSKPDTAQESVNQDTRKESLPTQVDVASANEGRMAMANRMLPTFILISRPRGGHEDYILV